MLFGLDVIFVVDSSSSIDDDEWATALNALAEMVANDQWFQVGTETRVGERKF